MTVFRIPVRWLLFRQLLLSAILVVNLSSAWVSTVTTIRSTAISSRFHVIGNGKSNSYIINGEHITTTTEDSVLSKCQTPQKSRRDVLAKCTTGIFAVATGISPVLPVSADTDVEIPLPPVEVTPLSSDGKKLFNEGRALESQGNMIAAQRLYNKVTKISPRFIYGWSNLGNTQVALGDLPAAEENYSKAINLCKESSAEAAAQGFGIKKCSDLYVLLLNRGTVRLNTPGRKEEALRDLRQASTLRERPDAVILQNLARAEELNGLYNMADKNYNLAISMTANEVNPFWLRSAMVKLQLGDLQGGRDLLKRVENRFPDAPEVKAASATFLWAMQKQQQNKPAPLLIATTSASATNASDDTPKTAPVDYLIDAQRKFLEIPDRPRLRFVDSKYLEETIAWPPLMIEGVTSIARNVGDYNRGASGIAEVPAAQ
eukprot:CAMPEP_0168169684 /NCGR_PEP_ID=MMETSP0139_2-20121125/3770_1 /TAXON_ID=44445 /ORGANISM="Pseudo-nitzschia australis, Strain 10249 10 AB" /LENGTH=430 /DNA_ID=CAMNT_0008087121 /DNA_START=77 /DNA_END=1369 /DNA_ORIENTATION=+